MNGTIPRNRNHEETKSTKKRRDTSVLSFLSLLRVLRFFVVIPSFRSSNFEFLLSAAWIAAALLIFAICAPLFRAAAQSGALIPVSIKNEVDPAILSLPVMKVEVKVDNQYVWVKVLQIFDNHTNQILEGKYLFALPTKGSIADFAVWDGDLRLPGVILEKRRANQLYSEIKAQLTDPGLLQQDDEHGGASAFSAKVFPIPAYGTKRVELEYTEMLPIENLASRFSFPLKPSFGPPQKVGEFILDIQITSDTPISPLRFTSKAYAMQPVKAEGTAQQYRFTARDIELKEDLSFEYKHNIDQSRIAFIAHRAPERITAYDLRDPAQAQANPDGYFESRAIFKEQIDRSRAISPADAPRNVLVMLDTSLSMHGEKLARAVEGLDLLLHSLETRDQFNLAVFNDKVTPLGAAPLPATPENVERALSFVKSSMLGGGTDLNAALLRSIELAAAFPAGERSVILISDANATLKTASGRRIAQAFHQANTSDTAPKIRLLALGLGTDANQTLLEELTRKCRGYFAQVRETDEIEPQMRIVFSRIGRQSIEALQFAGAAAAGFTQVYSTQTQHSFDGSSFAFVGRYKTPQPSAEVKIQGQFDARTISLTRQAALPEREDAHAHLPRLWARARVDALLYEINLNGEREDYIAEIIRLSQKYKFVTPYTAFLAAPRSLLRPRVIQPGDPVIRVKTDPSIKEVFAVLPFGETLPLKYLAQEGVWEARFLAPAWMPDGTYRCRLLLTDKQGNGYQEEKSFVIDSHAPRLAATVDSQSVRAGGEMRIKVNADRDAMRLVAKMYGAAPVPLAWSDADKASLGRLQIPKGLVPGTYTLTVMAEDFAHNQSSIELQITVIGN